MVSEADKLIQAMKHFASGVNSPGDALGLAGSLRHFGITATDIRDGLLEAAFMYAGNLQRLFVDTGAFGEVAFGPEGVRVVRPITDADWDQIFVLLLRCVIAYGKRCYVVAPDRVGCQPTTLARMELFAARVQLLAELGGQVIVPVQKGELAMSEMFRRSCEILGVHDPIAGVPMKKDATSLDDLRELVSSLPRHCRIHLLGIGPESPRFWPAVEMILELRPDADITSDSVTLRRLVGRTNGPKGGPRALTRYQDQLRAEGGWPSHAVKAVALEWQGADELGFDRYSQGAAIGVRSDARIEIDLRFHERRDRLAAARRPAVQLRLVMDAA